MTFPAYSDRYQRWIYRYAGWLYDLFARRFFLIFHFNRGRRFILDHGRFAPGQRVVSLGCGTGIQERLIAERLLPDGELIGIDTGPALVARARRLNRHPHVAYLCEDARHTSLMPREYDRALLSFFLHELPQAARAQVLQEAQRLLKPDGLLVVADHRVPLTHRWRLIQKCWWPYWFPGNQEKRTAWDLLRRGIDVELALNGFRVVERHPYPPDGLMEVVLARPATDDST